MYDMGSFLKILAPFSENMRRSIFTMRALMNRKYKLFQVWARVELAVSSPPLV